MVQSAKAVNQGGNIGVWTAVGVGAGVAIGVATGDLAMWTGIGAAGGVAVGAALHRRET